MSDKVTINGARYAPVDEERAEDIAGRLASFTLEGETFWRNFFIERDTKPGGERYGMYAEGDEQAPFFSEAFLYNLLGKDEARSVLGIIRELCELAGVER
jgi:hypothetical protein